MAKVSWKRCIAHVDMDAFFASIEQKEQPKLRGQPIAITNGNHGSCVITCSYEARAYGIKTGMRFAEARQLCAQVQQCPSRPELYAKVSQKIMGALRDEMTPDIEVYSIDEAFLDLSHVHMQDTRAQQVAKQIQLCIQRSVGLPASVGIGGDKTTAKLAAKKAKPYGVWVVAPTEAKQILANMPVDKLCGIGTGIRRFLAKHGAHTCGAVANLPVHILSDRFGHGGKRIWLMCQGRDPDPIHKVAKDPKTMGHGKILPPGVRTREKLRAYLSYMAFKLSCRLQQHGLRAQKIWIGAATDRANTGVEFPLNRASHDYCELQQLLEIMLQMCWKPKSTYKKIQITALDLCRAQQQDMLLQAVSNTPSRNEGVEKVLTEVNNKFGFATLRPASLQQLASPDVIAPSWQPDGPRQTIPDRKALPARRKHCGLGKLAPV